MNRRRIKLYCVMFLLVLVSLCGCGTGSIDTKKSEKVRAEIEDVAEIPEDGIITQEQFEAFAETDRIVTFQGEADGIKYAWTFSGRNIHNPQDMNLKIDFVTAEAELQEIRKIAGDAPYALGLILQGDAMITVPTLRIELPDRWEADTAVYCFEDGGKAMKLSDAGIQVVREGEQEYTVLSVDITETGRTFYIVAGNSAGSSGESVNPSGLAEEDTALQTEGEDPETQPAAGQEEAGIETAAGKQNGTQAAAAETQQNHAQSGGSQNEDRQNNAQSGGSQQNNTQASDSQQNSAKPVENQQNSTEAEEDKSSFSVTISINCADILQHMDQLDSGKAEFVPADGVILGTTVMECEEGDSVFDVLLAVCRKNRIHMEHSYFPAYGSEYIEGINQLYEFDCGPLSGWKYSVNGWYPNYGCDRYILSEGDVIRWNYVCE